MKTTKTLLLLLLVAILLTGCDDPFGATTRAQLRVDEKREDNRYWSFQALITQAKADIEKNKWEGAAMFVGVLTVSLQPIYGMTIAVVLGLCFGMPIYYRIVFPERYRKEGRTDA